MEKTLNMIAAQYRLNRQLIERTLKDTKEADWGRRPSDRINNMHWIAGHIAHSRIQVAALTGLKESFPGAELFARGKAFDPAVAYPRMAVLLAAFGGMCDRIDARLDSISAEELAADPGSDFPAMERTVLGALAFMSFHEAYHLGQIHLIRKLFGYDRMFG